MKNKYFKRNPLKFDQEIKPGQKNVHIDFEFDELTKEQIYKDKNGYGIKATCSCSANFVVTDKGITVSYNDNTKEEDVNLQKDKKLTVSKSLYVYLDDGKPYKVKNNRGNMVTNNKKKRVKMRFIITVTA